MCLPFEMQATCCYGSGQPVVDEESGAKGNGVKQVESNRNNLGCWIQPAQVIRVACNDRISPLPGKDYHRRVDDVGRVGSAAKFSTRTGKLLIQSNDFDFLAP
jgi:hypothetical protein